MKTAKIGVLVSGKSGGTNFGALLEAIERGDLHAQIVLLVSTNQEHGAVARAHAAGIKTLVLPPDTVQNADDWEHQVADALYQEGASLLVLAGYLRRVSAVLLEAYPRRIFERSSQFAALFRRPGNVWNARA